VGHPVGSHSVRHFSENRKISLKTLVFPGNIKEFVPGLFRKVSVELPVGLAYGTQSYHTWLSFGGTFLLYDVLQERKYITTFIPDYFSKPSVAHIGKSRLTACISYVNQ
jgi:hypothetical protein